MSKLKELANLGQSIWYDYIRRSFLTSGELQSLVEKGLRGVTSNPTIFEKAIAGSSDYDADLQRLVKEERTVEQIYEALALQDIAKAADLLRAVYDATRGLDGYVSLEVSPTLAHNTAGTIEEARRLYSALNRPNVMIKVPATPAGIPAITELIGSGINVNVTLIFAIDNYRSVAEAYLAGLEKLRTTGGAVGKVASVASFFVSRVDTAVDQALAERGNRSLMGKAAVANSKVAYALSKLLFSGARWDDLSSAGARVQRLLWASTGTKNPDYSDTLYVDQLIGQDTVNTVPPATLTAFLDHGTVTSTLAEGVDEAQDQISRLSQQGIDMDEITKKLQEDGVDGFAKSFDKLMESIEDRRHRLLDGLSQAA